METSSCSSSPSASYTLHNRRKHCIKKRPDTCTINHRLRPRTRNLQETFGVAGGRLLLCRREFQNCKRESFEGWARFPPCLCWRWEEERCPQAPVPAAAGHRGLAAQGLGAAPQPAPPFPPSSLHNGAGPQAPGLCNRCSPDPLSPRDGASQLPPHHHLRLPHLG